MWVLNTMKKLLRILLLLPSLALALPTAKTVTVIEWDAPSTYDDGSLLSLAEIGGYFVYWRTESGSYTDANAINVTSGTSANLYDVLAANGKVYFTVTTYLKSDTSIESGFSPEGVLIFNGETWTIKVPSSPGAPRFK